uniref:RRM domain-containing protein n=1 Tax=Glossina brevipalpis TaxID=37001 RepID=A0A1A9WQQ7_9MUSC
MDSSYDTDSDYNVDEYVKPDRIIKPINDETADILGNFDDQKRKQIIDGTFGSRENSYFDEISSNEDNEKDENQLSSDTEEHENIIKENDFLNESLPKRVNDVLCNSNKLSKEQLTQLMRGTAKANRHVLYVTNLNFDTSKTDLEEHFSKMGTVRGVRVPKNRRGGFAFVEMDDLEGYQRGFDLHNTELQGRRIKVQFSEGGKKKSANKKNILKQKNRKLAEMRNEVKAFTKSGKFYDKTLKKEKASELLARKRWRCNKK